jgi:hypothetical protein
MAHYRSNGGGSGRVDEANRSLMEQENDLRWMELGQKVDMLKSVSYAWKRVALMSIVIVCDVSISSAYYLYL